MSGTGRGAWRGLRAGLRIIDTASLYCGYAVSVLLPATVLVIFYEVMARYAFDSPTSWAQETAIFMFAGAGLFGGAYAMQRRAHINVDILYGRLTPRGRAILDSLTAPLIFFFLGLVLWYGWDAAWDAMMRGLRRPTDPQLPLGPFLALIPAGALMVLAQAVANWVRSVHTALTGRSLDQ